MSTKKLSLKYLQNKIKKESKKNIEILEGRLQMVKNKIKTNKNQQNASYNRRFEKRNTR